MSTIILKAREIVEINGMSDRITLLQGKMEEVVLPCDKVDIIISEWMGYFLLYESMLDTVLYARDNYLAKGTGLIFPDKATIWIAGIEDGEYKEEKIGCESRSHSYMFKSAADRNSDARTVWDNVYGFNYTPLKHTALSEPLVDTVEMKAVVTDPAKVLTLDLYNCNADDLTFSIPFSMRVRRDDFIHALVSWFDIDFTACHKPISFSTGPHTKYTHWKQTVFYLHEVLTVRESEDVSGVLAVRPNSKNRRDLDIDISYSFDCDNLARRTSGKCEYRMC